MSQRSEVVGYVEWLGGEGGRRDSPVLALADVDADRVERLGATMGTPDSDEPLAHRRDTRFLFDHALAPWLPTRPAAAPCSGTTSASRSTSASGTTGPAAARTWRALSVGASGTAEYVGCQAGRAVAGPEWAAERVAEDMADDAIGRREVPGGSVGYPTR